MTNSLVLLSGGMDSTTLLAREHARGAARMCLSVDYGQRHRREVLAAEQVAKYFEIPWILLDLSSWGSTLTGSALTDPSVPVPHGHYADQSMRATVVPNRNAVLLMAAVGVAQARGLGAVSYAAHAGDHPIYPDCRPEFVEAIGRVVAVGTDNAVMIHAPFLSHTKIDIARIGASVGAPLHLSWSCYEGGELHCGRCGTCVERREAFDKSGVPDPTVYAS